jgi:hypothetical protein
MRIAYYVVFLERTTIRIHGLTPVEAPVRQSRQFRVRQNSALTVPKLASAGWRYPALKPGEMRFFLEGVAPGIAASVAW